jgi:hypothetical protein
MITNDWLVTYSQNDIGKSKERSAIAAKRESYKYSSPSTYAIIVFPKNIA